MRLLLVRGEGEDGNNARTDTSLIVVPDGFNPDTALNHTILPFPDAYVVAEFEIVGDALDLKKLEEYSSYTLND